MESTCRCAGAHGRYPHGVLSGYHWSVDASITDPRLVVRHALADIEIVGDRVAQRAWQRQISGLATLPRGATHEHASTQARWLLRRVNEDTSETPDADPTGLADLAARAGAPVESVARFAREVHRGVWEHLADRGAPADLEAQQQLGDALWDAADLLIHELEVRYHGTQTVLRTNHKESLDQLALALLASDGQDQLIARRFCEYLNTSDVGSWLTAVGASSAHRKALMVEAERLTLQGYPAHCLEFDTLPILIAQLKSPSRAIPNDWLRTTTCGYAVAVGLPLVPEAMRVARQVAMALPSSARGRWSIKDNWIRVATTELRTACDYIRAEVMASGEALDPEAREQLLTVLRAYLRTGSVRDTAAECFLHRNTVLNRLRRVRDLTGLDVTVPKDSALLLLTFGPAD